MGTDGRPRRASLCWPHAREMQVMQAMRFRKHMTLNRRRWTALMLCMALGACQAPSSTASTDTPSNEAVAIAPVQAVLRPAYSQCVQDARGMDDQLEACDASELAYQRKQMEAEVARLMNGPDGPAKDRWMDEQANWAEDTDKRCAPASDHVGPMLDAQSCRINRYANRAVELHKRTLSP